MSNQRTKKLVVAMSTSCLDYYARPHNVRILPLNIHIGKDTFIDGQTITAGEFEDWLLDNVGVPVKTSPPVPTFMNRFFMQLIDEGYQEILFITMSSQLSKTYHYVQEILPTFANKLKIHVFDTRTGTFAEGYMALEADRCLRSGMTIEQTIAHLHTLRRNNVVMFGVHDLSYLINNNRLSAAAGFVANMLNIKPIIQVSQTGEAVVGERIMLWNRTMSGLAKNMEDYLSRGRNHKPYLLYTGRKHEIFNEFEKIVAERTGLRNLPAYPITPVVSAHTGPNCVGFGMFWE